MFVAFGEAHCPSTGFGHVALRSSWYGVAIVYAGQSLAPFTETLLVETPLAITLEMAGLFVVTKLPQVFWKAVVKSAL